MQYDEFTVFRKKSQKLIDIYMRLVGFEPTRVTTGT